MKRKYSFAALLVAAAFSFVSCFNLVDTTPSPFLLLVNTTYFTATGGIDINGAIPEEVGSMRSALPAFPSSSLTWYAEATSGSGATAVTKYGTVSDDHQTYSIPFLEANKEWTIKIYVIYGSNEILSASYGIPANTYSPENFTFQKDVILLPVKDSTVTGTVSLSMTVDSTDIRYLTIDLEGQTQKTFSRYGYSPYSWQTTPSIYYTNVTPGTYTATVSCYNSSNPNKILLYKTEQSINVVSGLTTSVWEFTGGTGPVKNESGTISFHITAADLAEFARTQVYVGANSYNSSPSDSTANGSIFSPFATFSGAVTYVNQLPEKNADDTFIEYTVHLKDGYLEELTTQRININRNITIECWKDSPGDKKGIATVKCCDAAITKMFYINNSLTLEGIKTTSPAVSWSGLVIDGNKSNGMATCGVYANSGANFKMKGGTVKNCKITDNGAGVFIWSGAFTMEGGIISANESLNESLGTYYGGGGVYMRAGSFTMTDGEIFGNEAQSGAGIINDDDAAILKISGGKIYDNHSLSDSSQGGAIKNHGTLLFYGTAVIGDDTATSVATASSHSNSAAFGAGIYSSGNSAKVYIGYSDEDTIDPDYTGGIYYNYASGTSSYAGEGGGGICIYTGDFKVAGGNISFNYSGFAGGGINARKDFPLSGITMHENETAGNGGAICSYNIELSGKVVIPYGVTDATTHNLVTGIGKNDVYLSSSKKITVTGALDTDTLLTLSPSLAYNSRVNEVIDADTGITFTDDTLSHFTLSDTDWNLELLSTTSIIVNAPIYLNSTGPANTSVTGTKSHPFGSWAYGAKEAMNNANVDYTVYIDGFLNNTLNINDSITNDATETGKRYAKSITIIGAHDELDASGNLQDGINKIYTSTGAAYDQFEVRVSTKVPVTIKNLWIKGGKQTNRNGGGLDVQAGAKVTLDEGVLISNNTVCNTGVNENGGAGVYVAPAAGETPAGVLIIKDAVIKQNNAGGESLKYGGGIFNEGNTYIYGTSVIGGTNSGDGNSADNGGGIYNTGCLYLGITETGADANWTGGIYGNEATYCGGGIYNKSKLSTTGIIKMRKGAISKNVCTFTPSIPSEGEQLGGGGIYCEGNDNSSLAKVFLYGDAVIGDSTATSVADESNCSNKALNGAGIYLNHYSRAYLGYKSETATVLYNKGIYYNYASASTGEYGPGGGGIYCESLNNSILISSGTIAYNKSESDGGGIRDLSNSDLTFYGGTIKQNRCGTSKKGGQICKEIGKICVKGNAAAEGDAYVYCDSVQVDGALTPVSQNGLTAILEPTDYDDFLISFGSPLEPATTSLAAYSRFAIAPKSGPVYYGIDKDTGRPKNAGFMGDILPGAPKHVGDIVFMDGSAKTYTPGMTLTGAERSSAVAVIFYAGTACNNTGDTTTRYLGVGLKRSEDKRVFAPYGTTAANSQLPNTICNASGAVGSYYFSGKAINGINNYNSVSSSLGAGAANTAFGFAQNYKAVTGAGVSDTLFEEGWYSPSVRELYALGSAYKDTGLDTASTFRKSLELVLQTTNPWTVGDGGENWYWSSSQAGETNAANKAYAVQFTTGVNVYVSCQTYTKTQQNYCLAIHQFY